MYLLMFLSFAFAGQTTEERLAQRATQPDVVLTPPVGEPSPKTGSFLIPYTATGEPDPRRVGTYEVGPSSCSEELIFKTVKAAEVRKELWMVDSGVGAQVGLPTFGLQMGGKTKSMAGLNYTVKDKLIVDGGLKQLEECCLRAPDKCTDRYISEFWRGVGSIHRLNSSSKGLKVALKQLDQTGQVDFSNAESWSVGSSWNEPMYFAYRVQSLQLPSCKNYMNDLPEQKGMVLFTGVSERVLSEQKARRDARSDARQQAVQYLGEYFEIKGDKAISHAEGVIKGVKDSLTCMDDTIDGPEGPQYLARVRMYVPEELLQVKP